MNKYWLMGKLNTWGLYAVTAIAILFGLFVLATAGKFMLIVWML